MRGKRKLTCEVAEAQVSSLRESTHRLFVAGAVRKHLILATEGVAQAGLGCGEAIRHGNVNFTGVTGGSGPDTRLVGA